MKPTKAKDKGIPTYLLTEIAITAVFIGSVRLLYSSSYATLAFWCGYLPIGIITILCINSNSSISEKLLSVIVFSLSTHLLVPLAQPIGLPLDHDALYTGQVAQMITNHGNWLPGQGYGDTSMYSLFPILPINLVVLSYITSINIFIVEQYLMLAFSPLFIISIFFFVKRITHNSEMAIFSAFLFATNPIIHVITTRTAYQGLGYVFVSLVLMSVFFESLREAFLFCLFSFAMAMTHHLASYSAILYLIVVAIAVRLSKARSVAFNMQIKHTRNSILYLMIVVASWLSFVAFSVLPGQVDMLSVLYNGLLNFRTSFGGELTGSFAVQTYSPLETFFKYAGVATITLLGLVGSTVGFRRKQKFETYIFLFGLGMSALTFFVIPWQLFGDARGLRARWLDYAYLYLVPAAVLGAVYLKTHLSSIKGRYGLGLFAMLLLLLTPSILSGIPEHYYTSNYAVTYWNISFMNSLEWRETAKWVNQSVPLEVGIWCSRVGDNFLGGLYGRNNEDLEYFFSRFPTQPAIIVVEKLRTTVGGLTYNFTEKDLQMVRESMNRIHDDGSITVYGN